MGIKNQDLTSATLIMKYLNLFFIICSLPEQIFEIEITQVLLCALAIFLYKVFLKSILNCNCVVQY